MSIGVGQRTVRKTADASTVYIVTTVNNQLIAPYSTRAGADKFIAQQKDSEQYRVENWRVRV